MSTAQTAYQHALLLINALQHRHSCALLPSYVPCRLNLCWVTNLNMFARAFDNVYAVMALLSHLTSHAGICAAVALLVSAVVYWKNQRVIRSYKQHILHLKAQLLAAMQQEVGPDLMLSALQASRYPISCYFVRTLATPTPSQLMQSLSSCQKHY